MRQIEKRNIELKISLDTNKIPNALSTAWGTFIQLLPSKDWKTALKQSLPHLLTPIGIDLQNHIGNQAFAAISGAFIQTIQDQLTEDQRNAIKLKKSHIKTSYNFESFVKDYPTEYQLYHDLELEFYTALTTQGISPDAVRNIVELSRLHFKTNLEQLINDTNMPFESFKDYYNHFTGDERQQFCYEQRQHARQRCREGLPLDNDLNLNGIYVTPSCKYTHKQTSGDNEAYKESLITAVEEIVFDTADKNIVFIKGQPGHGKTSFAHIFLKKIVEEKIDIVPLFIKLPDFKKYIETNNIITALSLYFGKTFLDQKFFRNKKNVLIFDALDELLLAYSETADKVKNRIFELIDEIERNDFFKVIITSRTHCLDAFSHIFPTEFHIFEINDFTKKKDYETEKDFTKIDLWIDKYTALKNIPEAKELLNENNFKKYNLMEFIGQPVLLTMIAKLFIEENFAEAVNEKITTKTDIYTLLVRHTLIRKWAKPSNDPTIFQHFSERANGLVRLNEDILADIAYMIFSSGGVTIHNEYIENNIDSNIKYDLDSKQLDLKKFIEKIKILFYFKDQPVYEFVHLSFTDYFMARKIMTVLKDISQEWHTTKGDASKQKPLIDKIYLLLGRNCIGEDQLVYLRDFVQKIDDDNNPFDFLDGINRMQIAHFLKDRFEEFKKHTYIVNIKDIPQIADKQAMQTEINTLMGLLHLILIFKPESVEEDNRICEFEDVFEYLAFQNFINSQSNLHFYKNFKFDDVKKILIKTKNNLSGADLSGADLYRADLSGAKLSGAKLSGADLYGADLSRADLSGADLSGAYLYRADLSGADLSGAYLSGADLYRADLSGAKLNHTLLFDSPRLTANQIWEAQNYNKSILNPKHEEELGLKNKPRFTQFDIELVHNSYYRDPDQKEFVLHYMEERQIQE